MNRRVEWSQSALDDLTAQIGYVAADDRQAAQRIAAIIRKTGTALGEFATGHPGRVAGTYEKSVQDLPYILAYVLTQGDTVVSISRVIHTSRNWLDDMWPD